MSGNSARWLCAAATVTGAAAANAESASEGKELVVLGDSFTANTWDPLSMQQQCARGQTAWAAQLSQLMGIHGPDQVANTSCLGASIDSGPGYTLAIEASNGAKVGAFGPRTKLDFLDARALTAGHGLCSVQPWVNGVFNPSVDIDGLPFHPSPAGDAVVAKALYERYGG